MAFPANAEVLAANWSPPSLTHREGALRTAHALLVGGEEAPPHPATPLLIEGPAGSGTSALARCAARELQETYRHRTGSPARIVAVRVRGCAGTTGVAERLLQAFDEGFRGPGFPVAEILAGFLRRAQREGRAVVVVLDDVAAGVPDLQPVLRALLAPERFLPEGVERAVPLHLIVAASGPAEAFRRSWERIGGTFLGPIRLSEPSATELRAIVKDRAARALGSAPPEELLGRVVHATLEEGPSVRRAIERLREALLPPSVESVTTRAERREIPELQLEPRIAEALAGACAAGPTTLSELRAWEAKLARRAGERPLAATTLWRRLVRLEQEGFLRRDVRSGGPGGSHSTIRLIRPAAHLPQLSRRTGTPPAFGGWGGPPVAPPVRPVPGAGATLAPRFVGPARAPGPRPPGT
jgi:hypothetical protein